MAEADAEAEAAAAAEAEAIEAATEHWDAPWHDLSVRELRALVRDLPIDRSSLPAPIELLRGPLPCLEGVSLLLEEEAIRSLRSGKANRLTMPS